MGTPNYNLKPTMTVKDTATKETIAYYSMTDAETFAGMTTQGLNKRVKNFNEAHPDAPPVRKISFGDNAKAKYYTQEDLRRVFGLKVIAK